MFLSIRQFISQHSAFLACNTNVSVSIAFGGKAWPISAQDMNLGRVSTGASLCAGGIFDLTAGSSIGEGGGNPNWVVGATFLKNVYSVFRYQPAAIGFAQLSDAAGGSSGECCNLASPSYGKFVPRNRRFQLIKVPHPLFRPLLALQVLQLEAVAVAVVAALAPMVNKLIHSTLARSLLTKVLPLSTAAASFKISFAMLLTAATSLFAYLY